MIDLLRQVGNTFGQDCVQGCQKLVSVDLVTWCRPRKYVSVELI